MYMQEEVVEERGGKNTIMTPGILKLTAHTLIQSYKRTPNIFYASSKSKNQLCIFSISLNKPRLCRCSESYFISKRRIRLARTKSE